MNFHKINNEEELREELFKPDNNEWLKWYIKKLKEKGIWDKLDSFYIPYDDCKKSNSLYNWKKLK